MTNTTKTKTERRIEVLARVIDDPSITEAERENAMRRYGELRNALARMA